MFDIPLHCKTRATVSPRDHEARGLRITYCFDPAGCMASAAIANA